MLQLQKCFSWNAEMLVTDCAVGVQTIQAKPTVLNQSAIFVYFVLAQRFSNRPSRNQIFCRCSRHDDVEIEDGLAVNMHGKYWAGNYGGPDFWLPGKKVEQKWNEFTIFAFSFGWYWLETAQWERALCWDISLMVGHLFVNCGLWYFPPLFGN